MVPRLLGGTKYMLPDDVKLPEGDTERRRLVARADVESLVKLALKCESAEEMGKKLKRRFDRSYQRQGIAPPGRGRAAEAEAELDRLLAQDWARRQKPRRRLRPRGIR